MRAGRISRRRLNCPPARTRWCVCCMRSSTRAWCSTRRCTTGCSTRCSRPIRLRRGSRWSTRWRRARPRPCSSRARIISSTRQQMVQQMKLRNPFALALLGLAGSVQAATTMKIATVAPDGTAWMREMRAGADALKKRTEGRVEIKYYPGGVMGDEPSVLRKIKIGQLQGGAFTGGELSAIVKDAQIYSLPFLFKNQEEVD